MGDKSVNGFKYIRNEQYKRTLEELAEELGVSKQIVYMWESRKKKIPDKRLAQLKEITGIPVKYFLLDVVSEREKMEINNYRLNKELDDYAFEYEDVLIDQNGEEHIIQSVHLDSGILEHIELNKRDIQIHDLTDKIHDIINECYPHFGDKDFNSVDDILSDMDTKISIFNRMVDIINVNNQSITEPNRIYLYQTIRAMELFFGIGEENHIWGKEPKSFHNDWVSDETPLVQELVNVMKKNKKERDEQMKKDYEDYKECFGDDEDLY